MYMSKPITLYNTDFLLDINLSDFSILLCTDYEYVIQIVPVPTALFKNCHFLEKPRIK